MSLFARYAKRITMIVTKIVLTEFDRLFVYRLQEPKVSVRACNTQTGCDLVGFDGERIIKIKNTILASVEKRKLRHLDEISVVERNCAFIYDE